jgi:glutamine---fructose-6-phosphate transaminase (isomerizing)
VILGEQLKLIKLPQGEVIAPKYDIIDWEFENVDMGDYPHFFLKEIHEQPKIIENIALNSKADAEKLAGLINSAFGTFMVACGSAAHSAIAATYMFSAIAKKHINFSIGSEFNYLEDFIKVGSLVIPISQSGESVDVIEPVTRAKGKGAKIAAVVNVLGSTLFRMADEKILLQAGVEKSVVATKSYISMISILLMSAYAAIDKTSEAQELLKKAALDVVEILRPETTDIIKKIAKALKNKQHLYVLGRGLSYSTALETTLKLKEASYIHAEGFAGGELKHGVMALIEKGTPCIVIAPNDETYHEIISNAQEVKARGARIIGIGPIENQVFDDFIQTADLGPATMISQVVVAQLLSYYLALERGNKDPDKPRNLAKSVTVK